MDEPSDLLGALKQSLRECNVGGEKTADRRSTNLEATLDAAREAIEGRVPSAGGLEAVRQQRERLQTAQADLEGNVSGASLEGTARALVERIRQLYAENGQALLDLEEAVAGRDAARGDAVARRLRDITGQMFECQDAWQAEMRVMEQQAGGMVVVPEQYVRLYEACDQVARGGMPLGQWRQVLAAVQSDVSQTLQRVESGLGGMALKLAEDAYCQGLAEHVRRGLDESMQGLNRMGTYATSSDPEDLNKGWNILVSGTLRIQKAMHTLSAGQAGRGDVVILEEED